MKLSDYIKKLQEIETEAGDFYIVNSDQIIEPKIDFMYASVDLGFEEQADDYSRFILDEIRSLVE